jgi:hypothetical protein
MSESKELVYGPDDAGTRFKKMIERCKNDRIGKVVDLARMMSKNSAAKDPIYSAISQAICGNYRVYRGLIINACEWLGYEYEPTDPQNKVKLLLDKYKEEDRLQDTSFSDVWENRMRKPNDAPSLVEETSPRRNNKHINSTEKDMFLLNTFALKSFIERFFENGEVGDCHDEVLDLIIVTLHHLHRGGSPISKVGMEELLSLVSRLYREGLEEKAWKQRLETMYKKYFPEEDGYSQTIE